MGLEPGEENAEGFVVALSPGQAAAVLGLLIIVFFALRMRRAR